MSDLPRYPGPDPRGETLGAEFSQLSAEDQDLVLALVARLRDTAFPSYPPDVPFMDFEE